MPKNVLPKEFRALGYTDLEEFLYNNFSIIKELIADPTITEVPAMPADWDGESDISTVLQITPAVRAALAGFVGHIIEDFFNY